MDRDCWLSSSCELKGEGKDEVEDEGDGDGDGGANRRANEGGGERVVFCGSCRGDGGD